jgi:hypothetical protein
MENSNRTIIKLLFVLISFIINDGGKSVFLISNNTQIFFSRDRETDLELPHQHNQHGFIEDEKWVESIKYNFIVPNFAPLIFLFDQSIPSIDVSAFIGRPPKFV